MHRLRKFGVQNIQRSCGCGIGDGLADVEQGVEVNVDDKLG